MYRPPEKENLLLPRQFSLYIFSNAVSMSKRSNFIYKWSIKISFRKCVQNLEAYMFLRQLA